MKIIFGNLTKRNSESSFNRISCFSWNPISPLLTALLLAPLAAQLRAAEP